MARNIKYLKTLLPILIGLAPVSAMAAQATPAAGPVVRPSIIGGEYAQPGEFPSYVALLVRQFGAPKDAFFCGGTLIAPQWVLTAKHCNFHGLEMPDPPFNGYVWVDVIQGMTDRDAGNGRRVKVVQAFEHPDPSLDIALMKLEKPLAYTPVLLPVSDRMEKRLAPARTGLVMAGYGLTASPPEGTASRYLKKLNLTRWTDQQCATAWPDDPESPPFTNFQAKYMLCAGQRTEVESGCMGDSGGPLFRKVAGYPPVLVGVTSWGLDTCIGTDAPGVYARVSTAFPWIITTMARNWHPWATAAKPATKPSGHREINRLLNNRK